MTVNPAGELVVVPDGAEQDVGHDPERLGLLPAALAALARADEIWRFTEGEVEHQPHLLWREDELVVAGTRRFGGSLRLHTWFRAADPGALVRRYWAIAGRVHPICRYRAVHSTAQDVLYLHPEPHVPYRVLRVGDRHAVLGYTDARLGFPSLVGFEIQDARARAALLGDDPVLGNLLAIPCLVEDGAEPVPLSEQLASLLGCQGRCL